MANTMLLAGLALAVGLATGTPSDSGKSSGPNGAIDPEVVRKTVEALGTALNREYFDPVIAAKVSETLQTRLGEGRYQGLSTIDSLAKALTQDLFALTHDKHLVVSPVLDSPSVPAPHPATEDSSREVVSRRSNFGINASRSFLAMWDTSISPPSIVRMKFGES